MRGGDVGSGLKDRSYGRVCGSEGRWRSGSTSSLDKGRMYLRATSQMPLMDLKNLQFSLEDRDYSKINLVDLKLT
jgi:hypothetical protein